MNSTMNRTALALTFLGIATIHPSRQYNQSRLVLMGEGEGVGQQVTRGFRHNYQLLFLSSKMTIEYNRMTDTCDVVSKNNVVADCVLMTGIGWLLKQCFVSWNIGVCVQLSRLPEG